jgi:P27 family predicted phage terminase small subunit
MSKQATGRPVGRPAKPVEQHRALGNPSRKVLPAAPMPGEGLSAVSGVPVAPELMAPGLELWNRVWVAGRSWLSPEVDFEVVSLLCQAKDESEELRVALLRGDVPRWYSLPNGSEVVHPAVKQLQELRAQMTSWLASLGFSPADRARLGLGEVRQGDVLDELAKRRADRVKQA